MIARFAVINISFLIVTYFSLTPQSSTAQSLFENFYFTNEQISIKGNAVLNNADNDYIVVGETGVSNVSNPNIKNDGIMIKLGTDGRVLKQVTLGGPNDDMFYDIKKTDDNGFIICGRTDSFGEGNADILVVKCDNDLNVIWSTSYGGSGSSPIWGYDIGYSISPVSDGSYIIAGTTSSSFSTIPDRNDIYVIKIDAQGQLLWTKTFGKSNFDYAVSVSETQDNGFIITGTSDFSPFMIKINSVGDKLWSREYGGDEGLVGLETTDGEIITLSYVNGIFGPFGVISPEMLLLTKLDESTGQVIWSKVYEIQTEFFGLGYLFINAASLIKVDNDYIVSGSLDIYPQGATIPAQINPFMIKLDQNGDLIWGRQYPNQDNVHIHDIQKINSGYIATGYHTPYPSGAINKKKLYLLKTDLLGKNCNSITFTPAYRDTVLNNIVPVDSKSVGGIANSFNLSDKVTAFTREESCQVGCEIVIVESNNPIIMEDAKAQLLIETNGKILSGSTIDYQAGSEITMMPDFEVSNNAVYHAFIAPCN